LTTAAHRRRASALRAARRRHDRESSGHAAFSSVRRQSPARVAGALADALLASDWRLEAMAETVRLVVGGRVRWRRRLVREVLRAYPHQPADRPRELREFLTGLGRPAAGPASAGGRPAEDGRRSAARQAPGPGRRAFIRHRLAVPTRAVRMRWGAPAIGDLAELATFLELDGDVLDWFADRREINRYARDEPLRHYRYAWRPHRLIEAPKPRLRAIQRLLLEQILAVVPVHERAHGFVPGRGAHTFAAAHTGRPVLISMDLRAFFSSITAARVYGLFRGAGYPEPVAHTLTALTTTRTPAHILRAAPDPALAALLRAPHLPQGAPTSPALANLCAFRLDRRLDALARAYGMTYGRYADDLAFSGAPARPQTARLIATVEQIAMEEGFRVRPDKTGIRRQSDRQRLAGLVVNSRPAAPRDEYDRLRATLHDAATHGLAEANRDGHPDFAAHLTGRVAWVAHGHPARAAKLHHLLEQAMAARESGP
jgi:RNA-directed DNA polymerase